MDELCVYVTESASVSTGDIQYTRLMSMNACASAAVLLRSHSPHSIPITYVADKDIEDT